MSYFTPTVAMLHRMKPGNKMILNKEQLPVFTTGSATSEVSVYDTDLNFICNAYIFVKHGEGQSWFNPTGYFAKHSKVGDKMFFCDTSRPIKKFRSVATTNMYRAGGYVSLNTVICIPTEGGEPFHALVIEKIAKGEEVS